MGQIKIKTNNDIFEYEGDKKEYYALHKHLNLNNNNNYVKLPINITGDDVVMLKTDNITSLTYTDINIDKVVWDEPKEKVSIKETNSVEERPRRGRPKKEA